MPSLADHLAALDAELQAAAAALDAAHIPNGRIEERVAALARENVALQDALMEATHTLAELRELSGRWQARAVRAEAQLAAARVELAERRPWLNER